MDDSGFGCSDPRTYFRLDEEGGEARERRVPASHPDTFDDRRLWRFARGSVIHSLFATRLVSNPHTGENGGVFLITTCGRFIGQPGSAEGWLSIGERDDASCRRCKSRDARSPADGEVR